VSTQDYFVMQEPIKSAARNIDDEAIEMVKARNPNGDRFHHISTRKFLDGEMIRVGYQIGENGYFNYVLIFNGLMGS
jgi:hypothetical protein